MPDLDEKEKFAGHMEVWMFLQSMQDALERIRYHCDQAVEKIQAAKLYLESPYYEDEKED